MSTIRINFLYTIVFIQLSITTFAQDNGFDLGSLEIINPNPVGSGARALGQGNAFIAIADDATASSWNPAGLTQLQKPEISFAVESVYHDNRTRDRFKKSDSMNLTDLNYASIVFPYSFDKKTPMVVSLNYLRLFQFDKNLKLPFVLEEPDPLIQGNYRLDQDGSFAAIGPAIAIELSSGLSFGVAFNWWEDDFTQNGSVEKREFSDIEFRDDGEIDTFTFGEVNEFIVKKGHSWVLGVLFRPTKSWTFATVIKPHYTLELDHKLEVSLLSEGKFNSRLVRSSSDLEFPWILGLGTAWRPTESLTFSGDMTWTDWSDFRFKEEGDNINPVTGKEAELKDAYTVRLGSEYNFVFEEAIIPLRMGVGYDPSPAVGEVDEYYTVSVGAGMQIGRLMFDVAYEFRWGNDVDGDSLASFDATRDAQRHRLLSSVILYF